MTADPQAEPIRQMFDRLAAGYDRRNSLFSLDRDRAWRRAAAGLTGLRPGDTALDLCTGTGRLARELLPMVQPAGRVIGIDFSPAMLARARVQNPGVDFREGDAVNLQLADESVDAVTIAFGLRNLVDRGTGLREMIRVLKPAGRLVILELAPPEGGLRLRLYRLYLARLMPVIARLLRPQFASAYRYLAQTVQAFPPPAALAAELERAGFRDVQVRRMTAGIVALHVGRRPA